jgi:hypothetical protein
MLTLRYTIWFFVFGARRLAVLGAFGLHLLTNALQCTPTFALSHTTFERES